MVKQKQVEVIFGNIIINKKNNDYVRIKQDLQP